MTRVSGLLLVAVTMGLFVCSMPAQAVPGTMNYQGQIEVQGSAYTGTGYFRFAVVGPVGEYYWSNDGQEPPIDDVSLDVTGGLFEVVLGDTLVMNPISTSIFDSDDLFLRVWFDDGSSGLQQLTPDQPMTSTGFSFKSGNTNMLNGEVGSYYLDWNNMLFVPPDFADGEDDDQPDDDSEVPDDISINNGRLFAPSGGNSVGIGTTTPLSTLHVAGNVLVDDRIWISNLQAKDTDGISFASNDGHLAMQIADYKVGIGTNTPATRLHVNGSITLDNGIFANSSNGIRLATDDGVTRMAITDSGYIGIGTTTPLSRLHVTGEIRTDFRVRTGELKAIDSDGITFVSADHFITMHIDELGQVGIGNIAPASKLHVNGDITINDTIHADDYHGIRLATDDGTTRLIVADSGDVGIGIGASTPLTKLHVNGDITVDDTILAEDTSGLKLASGDGTVRMTIENSGNIGIGTSSPDSLLHVNGTLTVDDTIQADNSGGLKFASDEGTVRMEMDDDGDLGIGAGSPGSHRLSVENNVSGPSGTTGFFKNTSTGGIAMALEAGSTDCTLLVTQNSTGNLINGDSNYLGWHRVFVVEGDGSTGINTGSPSRMLYVNGDAGGSSAWNSKSDGRLKSQISTIDNALDKVLKLRGVNFQWTDKENQPEGDQIGFISQEVMEILPEVVDKPDEYYSIQYGPITALLAEAVKDQQAIIDEQNDKIENQQEQIDELRTMMEKLAEEMGGLE